MSESQRTALYDFHERHGARFVPFGGWEMPVQYQGIMEEHLAVRQRVGLFDVSHMGEVFFRGPEALACVNYLVTNEVARLADGEVLYSPMCYADGGIVDDVLVYRVDAQCFFMCVNASNIAKDFAWMREQSEGFDCELVNESAQWSQLSVQGPAAAQVVGVLLGEQLAALARFTFAGAVFAGQDCWVSRTGYTGEDGFEVYCPHAVVETLAEAILREGEAHGLALVGLGARDSLRLEAGMALYGHEISADISPLEASLGWTVKLSGEDFVGKQALLDQKEAGVPRRLIHFVLDDRRIARQGAAVFAGETCVGEVVSGTFSPVLSQPIGAALVKRGIDLADLTVEVRKNRLAVEVKKAPLF